MDQERFGPSLRTRLGTRGSAQAEPRTFLIRLLTEDGKADMVQHDRHFRFVSEADIPDVVRHVRQLMTNCQRFITEGTRLFSNGRSNGRSSIFGARFHLLGDPLLVGRQSIRRRTSGTQFLRKFKAKLDLGRGAGQQHGFADNADV